MLRRYEAVDDSGESDGIQMAGNAFVGFSTALRRIIKKIPERDFLGDSRAGRRAVVRGLFDLYDGNWRATAGGDTVSFGRECCQCRVGVTIGGAVFFLITGSARV